MCDVITDNRHHAGCDESVITAGNTLLVYKTFFCFVCFFAFSQIFFISRAIMGGVLWAPFLD